MKRYEEKTKRILKRIKAEKERQTKREKTVRVLIMPIVCACLAIVSIVVVLNSRIFRVTHGYDDGNAAVTTADAEQTETTKQEKESKKTSDTNKEQKTTAKENKKESEETATESVTGVWVPVDTGAKEQKQKESKQTEEISETTPVETEKDTEEQTTAEEDNSDAETTDETEKETEKTDTDDNPTTDDEKNAGYLVIGGVRYTETAPGSYTVGAHLGRALDFEVYYHSFNVEGDVYRSGESDDVLILCLDNGSTVVFAKG